MHGYGTVADAVEVYCAAKLVRACASVVDAAPYPFVSLRTPSLTAREATEATPRVLRQMLLALNCPELELLAASRGCARGVRGKSKNTILSRLLSDGVTVDDARAALVAAWPVRDWDWFKKAAP